MPITGKQVKPTPPRKPIVPPAAHSAVISDEKMKDFFSFTVQSHSQNWDEKMIKEMKIHHYVGN